MGRPVKSRTLTQAINDYLQGMQKDKNLEEGEKEYRKRSRQDLLVQKLYDMGLEGDLGAIRYLIDRIEGRPAETIRTQYDDPLTVVITANKPRFGEVDEYKALPAPQEDKDYADGGEAQRT